MVSTRSTSGRDSSHSIHADSKVYSVQHSNGPVPNGIGAGYEQSLHKRPRALGSAREAEQYQHQADLREQQFLQRQDGSSVPLPPGLTQRQYDLIRESPFLDLDSPMTAYEWLKFVLYLPIFLIRLILIALLMPPCWLFSRLITIGMQPNQPLKPWRVALIRPFARFWAAVLLIVGMNCYFSVKGKENIEAARKARAMITINHVSYVDALALGQVFVPCGLAKASVIHVPFFGSFALMLQFLFVERRGTADEAHSKSQKGSVTSLIHERNRDARFPLFLMMPEGTTKGSNCLLPFSSGAFAFGNPVLPVLMRYRSRRFNVGWGSIQSVVWHILRLQAQFINHLTIEILPVYHPSPEEKADAKLYAENVRRYMAGKLGAQLSSHGMDEHSELKKARICVDWTGRHIIQLPPQVPKARKNGTHLADKAA